MGRENKIEKVSKILKGLAISSAVGLAIWGLGLNMNVSPVRAQEPVDQLCTTANADLHEQRTGEVGYVHHVLPADTHIGIYSSAPFTIKTDEGLNVSVKRNSKLAEPFQGIDVADLIPCADASSQNQNQNKDSSDKSGTLSISQTDGNNLNEFTSPTNDPSYELYFSNSILNTKPWISNTQYETEFYAKLSDTFYKNLLGENRSIYKNNPLLLALADQMPNAGGLFQPNYILDGKIFNIIYVKDSNVKSVVHEWAHQYGIPLYFCESNTDSLRCNPQNNDDLMFHSIADALQETATNEVAVSYSNDYKIMWMNVERQNPGFIKKYYNWYYDQLHLNGNVSRYDTMQYLSSDPIFKSEFDHANEKLNSGLTIVNGITIIPGALKH